jgi:DNA polymerase-3 subunit beta
VKFVAERKELLKALVQANSVVERSTTIPVLANVLLDVSGTGMEITATDLDCQIKLKLPVQVVTTGKTTVNAAMFLDIVRKLADGSEIGCEMVETQFVVKSGRARMKLLCLPAEDFPDFAVGKIDQKFKIEAADLCRLIRKAGMAVSNDESRYYLNGVFMHTSASGLTCVGTDGHRLSKAWMAAPEGAEKITGVIIPKKTTGLIAKHVDGGGEVLVGVSDSKIALAWGTTVLVSKLIDGSFPDYDRVIPKANNNRLEGSVKAIAAAVDRVTTVSTEKGRALRFSFDPAKSDEALTISVVDPNGGAAEDTVRETNYTGAELEIGFNARYVLDALSSLDAEEVIWELGDAGMPSIIRSTVEASGHMAVVMPMRVA